MVVPRTAGKWLDILARMIDTGPGRPAMTVRPARPSSD